MLECVIVKAVLSVCPSVRHNRDSVHVIAENFSPNLELNYKAVNPDGLTF